MNYEKELRNNAILGASIIKRYLNGEIAGSEKVRVAANAITQDLKFQATKGVTDTIKLTIGRTMANTPDELRRFIETNMPDYRLPDQVALTKGDNKTE